jgi:hypothetical protein
VAEEVAWNDIRISIDPWKGKKKRKRHAPQLVAVKSTGVSMHMTQVNFFSVGGPSKCGA